MEQSHSNPQLPQQGPTTPSNSNLLAPPPENSALTYLKTPVCILKIISVFLGLIALILAAYGYNKASLFNHTNRGQICDWNKKLDNDNENDDDEDDEYCEDGDYYRDQVCRNYNEFHKANQTHGYLYKPRTCPSRWLVIPQLYIIGIVWAAVLLLLIVVLFKQSSKSGAFPFTNLIGHVFAGGLTIIASICLIGFFWMVQTEDMCSDEKLRSGFDYIGKPDNRTLQRSSYAQFVLRRESTIVRNFPTFRSTQNSNSTSSPHHSRKFGSAQITDSDLAELQSKCPAYQDMLYLKWIFLSAGLIGLITGITYIVIALLSKKAWQSQVRPRPAGQQPWSMPQPSQAPTQMYQQQAYYGGYPPNQQQGYGYGYVQAPYQQQQQYQYAYQYPQNIS